MSNDDYEYCQHAIEFSDEETEGLKWLSEFLDQLEERGKKSAIRARGAQSSIRKIFQHAAKMHRLVHELEEKLEQSEMESAKLVRILKDASDGKIFLAPGGTS